MRTRAQARASEQTSTVSISMLRNRPGALTPKRISTIFSASESLNLGVKPPGDNTKSPHCFFHLSLLLLISIAQTLLHNSRPFQLSKKRIAS